MCRAGSGPNDDGDESRSGPERARAERGSLPESITVDNGSEFCSRALEAWAMGHDVQLCFICPGRPVENGFIESFNGRLRDECLSVEWSRRAARVQVGSIQEKRSPCRKTTRTTLPVSIHGGLSLSEVKCDAWRCACR
jgi:transposase InsO family protein